MKKKNNYTIFFGAGGAGKEYSKHTEILPKYYLDNDRDKWGKFLNGVEIKSPKTLNREFISQIKEIIITTGYIKSVFSQLIEMGVPRNLIVIPQKSLLGAHPFKLKKNRVESAEFLSKLINSNRDMHIVAGGGTALGFCRELDFIKWDTDIDLFASLKFKNELMILLNNLNCPNFIENDELKAETKLSSGETVPFAIKFFDPDKKIYHDFFEEYNWEWPIEMFLKSATVKIHGYNVELPNPPEIYLKKVYGKNWKVPNPSFTYNDYGKSK